MIVADDGTLGSFGSSTNLEATLTTTMLEPAKGRDIRVRAVRLASDVVSGLTVNMDSRKRLGGVPVQSSGNAVRRSEEHTSELQSLMRISYAVFCLKKKKHHHQRTTM